MKSGRGGCCGRRWFKPRSAPSGRGSSGPSLHEFGVACCEFYVQSWSHGRCQGVHHLGEVDAERLRAIPLFAGLPEPALAAVTGRLTLERYAAGADVVRRGDAGDKLYLIGRGEAEVVVGADGSERRVNLLHAGEFFGEMALLSGEPRSATVRTTTPTELYSLDQEGFRALLEREPAVREAVTTTMAERRTALSALQEAPAS